MIKAKVLFYSEKKTPIAIFIGPGSLPTPSRKTVCNIERAGTTSFTYLVIASRDQEAAPISICGVLVANTARSDEQRCTHEAMEGALRGLDPFAVLGLSVDAGDLNPPRVRAQVRRVWRHVFKRGSTGAITAGPRIPTWQQVNVARDMLVTEWGITTARGRWRQGSVVVWNPLAEPGTPEAYQPARTGDSECRFYASLCFRSPLTIFSPFDAFTGSVYYHFGLLTSSGLHAVPPNPPAITVEDEVGDSTTDASGSASNPVPVNDDDNNDDNDDDKIPFGWPFAWLRTPRRPARGPSSPAEIIPFLQA